MKNFIFLTSLFCSLYLFNCDADKVIWSGEVNSNGSPTEAIPLVINQKYQIKVSHYLNLGKWIQQGEPLASDACYEFNRDHPLNPLSTFKNSHDISVCNGSYHPNHIYRSNVFFAKQNRIHFWIYDTNYEDNSGSLHVDLISIEN